MFSPFVPLLFPSPVAPKLYQLISVHLVLAPEIPGFHCFPAEVSPAQCMVNFVFPDVQTWSRADTRSPAPAVHGFSAVSRLLCPRRPSPRRQPRRMNQSVAFADRTGASGEADWTLSGFLWARRQALDRRPSTRRTASRWRRWALSYAAT